MGKYHRSLQSYSTSTKSTKKIDTISVSPKLADIRLLCEFSFFRSTLNHAVYVCLLADSHFSRMGRGPHVWNVGLFMLLTGGLFFANKNINVLFSGWVKYLENGQRKGLSEVSSSSRGSSCVSLSQKWLPQPPSLQARKLKRTAPHGGNRRS